MVSKSKSLFLCSCLLLFVGTAAAQQGPMQLVTIKAKPGGDGGIEEVMTALVAAAEEQESKDAWLVAQSVTGEPTYTIAMPMASFSRLGEPPVPLLLTEAYGEDEARRLGALFSDSVESISTAFYTEQPQLSMPWDRDEAPDGFVLYRLTINPNMGSQYAETAALTREAAMAVRPEGRYSILRPGLGAGNDVLVIGFIADWADMDQPTPGPGAMVIQHFGQTAGAAIGAAAQETIGNTQVSLHRTRPDLAYQPEGMD